ncbi:hypothetical protein LDENG_00283470 [Lucifuga dentata]|nr:hypothetical protein LDENG_00283470 [Lucifuga dentata]
MNSRKRSHITPVLKSLHWLPVSFRSLRSSEQRLLVAPHPRFKTLGDQAFGIVAPKLWNELSSSLHFIDSEKAVKKQLKTFLFRRAFR